MKTINLPIGGIRVTLGIVQGSGDITSDLHTSTHPDSCDDVDSETAYNDAIDGIESLILAHACAGIDITADPYIEGVRTAIEQLLLARQLATTARGRNDTNHRETPSS